MIEPGKILERYEPPAPAYEGQWQAVVFQPDLISHQTLVVGVLVASNGCVDSYRILQDVSRMECIYPGASENVQHLLGRVSALFKNSALKRIPLPSVTSVTPHVKLTPPLFTSGDSAEQAVNRLYKLTVPLEPPPDDKRLRFESRDPDQVRNSINDRLKARLALRFEQVVHPNGLTVKIDDQSSKLKVTLFTGQGGACGLITSAWYSTLQTIETHTLRGLLDLGAARSYYGAKRAEMIVLRPVSGLPEKTLSAIDNLIDAESERAKMTGITLRAPSTDDEAAEMALELVGEG